MRILIIALLLVSSFIVVAQNFNPPLAGNEPDIRGMDICQTIQILDEYWRGIPEEQKIAKGSGYKIYQRWKYLREMEIKPDGNLMTADDFKDYAEQNSIYNTEMVEWEKLGPSQHEYANNITYRGIGRTNVIAVDPVNDDTYYVGAPCGGLWKTTDNGQTWRTLTDNLPTLGISGIAIDPNDGNVIYIATGDEDGADAVGMGVYKTTDGGETWSNIGLVDKDWCGDIYIHPNNVNCLYVCTSNGLYKTINGGETWENIAMFTSAREFRFKPGDPSVFYVMVETYQDWEFRKYINDGSEYTTLYSEEETQRVVFDIAPSNTNYIYILKAGTFSEPDQLFRSIDAGESFEEVNNLDDWFLHLGGQSYYNWAIAVADTDPNTVVIGGVYAHKSVDGGASFGYRLGGGSVNVNYLHADIHYIKFHNNRLFFATDGGVGVSEDLGESIIDKSFGLDVSQFYRVDVAQEADFKVTGGLQDNGGFAYRNESWVNYGGADGMDSAIDPTDSNEAYYLTQWGDKLIGYSFNENLTTNVLDAPGAGPWVVPLEFAVDGSLYAGYYNVYKAGDNSWLPYITSFNKSITQIKTNPFNSEELLVVVYGPTLYRASQGSKVEIDVPIEQPSTQHEITNVAYNQNIAGTIYITTKNNIYMSQDGGATLENITLGLEPAGNFVDIIHHKDSPNNSLYVIATRGVYYKDDSMGYWMYISDGLPNVHLTDIEVNHVENYLVLATYGRGVFRAPTPGLSLDAIDLAKDNDAVIYPNPTADAIMLKKPINEEVIVNISTIDGKLIRQQKYNQFNVDDKVSLLGLKAGTYIITFKSERHLITKKVIKQ